MSGEPPVPAQVSGKLGAAPNERRPIVDIALGDEDLPQHGVVRDLGERERVARQPEGLLGQAACTFVVPEAVRAHRHAMREAGDSPPVAELEVHGETLLVQPLGLLATPGHAESAGIGPQRSGTERSRVAVRVSEQRLESLDPLVRGVRRPEILERDGELQGERSMRDARPVEPRSKIVELGEGDRKIRGRVVVLRECGGARDPEHLFRVSLMNARGVVRSLELLRGELPDRLEHPETWVPRRVQATSEKALVEE